MSDRNYSDIKRNHNKDHSHLLLDRYFSNEYNAKNCSRKRNLPPYSDVLDEQIRKQSSSEEDDELDVRSNFIDENDDSDNSSTTEELEDRSCSNPNFNQTLSGTHAMQTSSLFRNSNSENQKGEIGIGYQFHGHNTTNFNGATRGFANSTDSICHYHSQQFVYTGHMPVSPYYVVSCSTVAANSTSYGESSYGRVDGIPISTITAGGTMNRNGPNRVESFIRTPFNSSKPTICNFGLSRTMYGNFGHPLPALYGMPICASETFCVVPGRTSLLSSTTKYHVTIGEIYRRISPPECLNASILGGILRKAKSKDGGKTLRDSLKRVGLTLPAGRRKAATVTAWTALVEDIFYFAEEALQMGKDFAVLSEKAFPVRQIAEFICNRMIWQDDPREFCIFIEHIRLFIKELSNIVNGEFSGSVFGNQQNPAALPAPVIQHGLTHFSLLTHGFGPLAFVTVFDTLTAMFDEMLKYYDRNEQHLNISPPEISVTHISPSFFTYANNM